ncbi:MAG: formylglycine-generating enzyme family protein [Verrucomicrobia bacterium]|nr:formylglycine-generating enzyme family protein [Verrucomicrobiota bacterium]
MSGMSTSLKMNPNSAWRCRFQLELRRICERPGVDVFWVGGLICAVLLGLSQSGCGKQPSNLSDKESSAPSNSRLASKIELVPLTNMVFIKAGTFVRVHHPVTLTRDFWLGKFEVTQAEYAALIGKNPSHFKNDPNRPVEKVTYYDALAYCSALTKGEREAKRLPPTYEYRLPFEAEWEFVCRGGTTNLYSFGDTTDEADQFAWTLENSEGATHPVGQKRPNPFGLHDVHGNVWEWCLDWFGDYPDRELQDPSGPATGKYKVFRGGSWNHTADFIRSGNRFMMAPTNGIYFVGFRVALSEISR